MPSPGFDGSPTTSNSYDMGYSSSQNGQNGQYYPQQQQQQFSGPPLTTPPADQQMQSQLPVPQMGPGMPNRYPTPDLSYSNMQSQPSSFGQSAPGPQRTQLPGPASQPVQPVQPIQPVQPVQPTQNVANRPANQSVTSLVSPPASDSPNSVGSVYESAPNNSTTSKTTSVVSKTQNNAAPAQQPPLDVYHTVTKAYDYTESYHFLMKFLPTR